MRQIASEMEDIFYDHAYWEDIHLAFEKVEGDAIAFRASSNCDSLRLRQPH